MRESGSGSFEMAYPTPNAAPGVQRPSARFRLSSQQAVEKGAVVGRTVARNKGHAARAFLTDSCGLNVMPHLAQDIAGPGGAAATIHARSSCLGASQDRVP